MADDHERTTSSAYPPPPSFYKHFTLDNVNRLKFIREQHSQSQAQDRRQQQDVETQTESPTQQFPSPSTLNPPSIPDDLAVLIPPEPPTSGAYTSFGDRWNISEQLPTLKQLNIEQLYPDPPSDPLASPSDALTATAHTIDRAQELRRLARSLLMNYLELVGIMSITPGRFDEKVHHLRIHLINMHQLINEYRPHQARETLILMMEEQLKGLKRETEENRQARKKVDEMLTGLAGYDGNGLLGEMAIKQEDTDGQNGQNGQNGVLENGRADDNEHVIKNDMGKEEIIEDRGRDLNSWTTLKDIGIGM